MPVATVLPPEESKEVELMGREFLRVLGRTGPAQLTQILADTGITVGLGLLVRDYLLEQGRIQKRPDKGRDKPENPLLEVYGLPIPAFLIRYL